VDRISETPPTKRRLLWDSQDDVPETPCPSGPPIDVEQSVQDVEGREEESAPPEANRRAAGSLLKGSDTQFAAGP
jgi:hypothetical protein